MPDTLIDGKNLSELMIDMELESPKLRPTQ